MLRGSKMAFVLVLAAMVFGIATASAGRELLQSTKLPKLAPCKWYQGDNMTFPDMCGTSDAYTMALNRNLIKNDYGKILYDNMKKNAVCEKQTDQKSCIAQFKDNNCLWLPNNLCTTDMEVQAYLLACKGSKAKTFWKCTTSYMTQATCNADPDCAWNAALAQIPQKGCFVKALAGFKTPDEGQAWSLSNGPNNIDPKFYASYWGTCATAKATRAVLEYVASCTTATDQGTCDDRLCNWSPPPMNNTCVVDQGRWYALQLQGGGPIKDQFQQCNSGWLASKGPKACAAYTIV